MSGQLADVLDALAAPPLAGQPATGQPATGRRTTSWGPGSWRAYPAAQQPDWPDRDALHAALAQVATFPPLIFAGEAHTLLDQLAEVAQGRAVLLQAGDCAETFRSWSVPQLLRTVKVVLQMAAVLTYGAGVPVVKVGRIAGQFAKPRSALSETVDGTTLPVFRGDIINSIEPTLEARRPDPQRVVHAYHQAAATLNLVRAFTKGGFADLHRVHAWNQEFVARSPAGQRYERLADGIERALRFLRACGIDLASESRLHQADVYTSHEALLLGFEEAMTRQDDRTGDWYDTSAHMLWVGERTRQLDGAHLAFLAGVRNPVGAKLGPAATPTGAVALADRLDPDRVPGRLTLITRLGAARVREVLPPLIQAVRAAGHPVVWACDPMHGNTFVSSSGRKTRRFDDVMDELRGFFDVHHAAGTWPGGIHVELTGEDVTECLGGAEEIGDGHLGLRYETACDPRLNASQSLELAFQVAELLR